MIPSVRSVQPGRRARPLFKDANKMGTIIEPAFVGDVGDGTFCTTQQRFGALYAAFRLILGGRLAANLMKMPKIGGTGHVCLFRQRFDAQPFREMTAQIFHAAHDKQGIGVFICGGVGVPLALHLLTQRPDEPQKPPVFHGINSGISAAFHGHHGLHFRQKAG